MLRFLLISLFCLLIFPTSLFAQKKTPKKQNKNRIISGKIKDDAKNWAVSGVTVSVQGEPYDTLTNFKGEFFITVPNYFVDLEFRKIGFKTQILEIRELKKDNFDLVMPYERSQTGFGTVKTLLASQTNSLLDFERIREYSTSNLENGLQGQFSGVQITQNNGSPAALATVRIRGNTSFLNQAEPLYVLDGVPITTGSYGSKLLGTSQINALADIDWLEIETVEVLKDAAALALYGMKGSNGVILIQTRKGGNEKTDFQLHYQTGFNTPTQTPTVLGANSYRKLLQESWTNAGRSGLVTLPYGLTGADSTDWIKEITRTGNTQQIAFSASGRKGDHQLFAQISHRKESGFIQKNDFARTHIRFNWQHDYSEKIQFGLNLAFSHIDQDRQAEGLSSVWAKALLAPPIMPVRKADENFYEPQANPVAILQNTDFQTSQNRLLGNLFLNYWLTDAVKWRVELGTDVLHLSENMRRSALIYPNARTDERNVGLENYNLNTYFELENSVDDHELHGLLGLQAQGVNTKEIEVFGENFKATSQANPIFAQKQGIVNSLQSTYRYLAGFASLDYAFRERFLLGTVHRYEGSSRLGQEARWAYFPAVSAGMILHKQDTLYKNKILTFLKISGSYGISGNTFMTQDFRFAGTYTQEGEYGGQNVTFPQTLGNPNLGTEKTAQWNATLDWGVWDQRIGGKITYYQRNSRNLLLPQTLPPSLGFPQTIVNVGEMENKGLEIEVFGKVLLTENLRWAWRLNWASNQNMVLKANGKNWSGQSLGIGNSDQYIVENQAVGLWNLATWAGVDPKTGQGLIVEKGGRLIEANAENIAKNKNFVGNPYPKIFGGFSNQLSYKNFSFDVLLNFAFGHQMYAPDQALLNEGIGLAYNQISTVENRWQKIDNQTDTPRLLYGKTPIAETTKYLYDADFVRVKTIRLAYDLPTDWVEKIYLKNAKIFVNLQNFITFTNFPFDPESNVGFINSSVLAGNTFFALPQTKSINIGFDLNF